MANVEQTSDRLEQELRQLRRQLADEQRRRAELDAELAEAQETLRAIRQGEVDALVVSTPEGQQIYTLQGADHTYRTLVEQMQEGAVTLVDGGLISYGNRHFAQLIGRPLEQVIGERFADFVADEHRDRFLRLTRQPPGESAHGEFSLRRGDGSEVLVRLSVSQVVLDECASLCVVVTDLTDRKRVDRVLASEQFIRRLIDHAPVGVAVVGRDLRYTLANPAYQSLAETPMPGRRIAEVFAPELAAMIEPLVRQTLATGQSSKWHEREAPLRGRSWWNVALIPLCDAAGEVEAVLLLTQDVTEERLAKNALLQSEQKFRTLADNMSQFAWMADEHGSIFWYNRRWYDYTGTTFDQMQGWGWQQVHDPEHVERVVRKFRQCVEAGKIWEDTFPLRARDGTYRWFLSRAIPIRDEQGKVLRWFGTNTDVTALRNAEEALRKSRELAERHAEVAESANVAKSQFLANMSHELRTPMNAILGMTDLALREELPPVVVDYLQTVNDSGKSLLDLLNQLLDLSRIEAGQMELERREFSLRETVVQVAKTLNVRAAEKNLKLICDVADEVPERVVGDPLRLRQVLVNLVGNAVKFTDEGEVVIAASVQSRGDRHVVLRIGVRDTGVGIAAEDQRRIFAPFAQADTSTTRRHGGSGLGLAIVMKLVRMMQGEIRLRSEPGRGSEFYFTVQLGLGSEPGARAPEIDHAPSGARAGRGDRQRPRSSGPARRALRVLLAEDTPANQKLVTYLLNDRGHSVEVAGDGQQALERLHQETFDVVLMDVQMPAMDGFQATAAIRRLPDPETSRVPIIAMTAHALRGDAQRCLSAGMDAYVSKPVNADELIELVERIPQQDTAAATPATVPDGDAAPPTDAGVSPEDEAPPAAGQAVADSPAFDPAEGLRICFDNEEMLQKMAASFLDELHAMLEKIRNAVARQNPEDIQAAAHRLKGTVLYLGAPAAKAAIGRVETLGRSGELDEVPAAVEQFVHEAERLEAAVRAYLNRR